MFILTIVQCSAVTVDLGAVSFLCYHYV